MSKYINAETLIDMLNAKADMALGTPKAVLGNVIKMIDLLPPADVVKVVRCKDCKYAKKSKTVLAIPDYRCLKTNITCLDADDFCSYGERKENND